MSKGNKDIIAVILAAGESKRMGKNKLLLSFNGKTIIENVIETIIRIGFINIILVCKDIEIKTIGKRYGLTVISNNFYKKGQSESIKVAVKNINEEKDIMFFVGDIPLISENTINDMINIFTENSGIVVARVNGKNKNPVIFHRKYKEDLLNLQGDIGGRGLINSNLKDVTFYEVKNSNELSDIDTLEDYFNLINFIE